MATMITTRFTRDTARPRPQCHWVPVRESDGRVRMQMRWTVGREEKRHAA